MAGEGKICRTTSLPPLNQLPSGLDYSKHFITFTGYLCKPGSLNIVPGTSFNPVLVIHACWPMLHWRCKQTIEGSLAASKLEGNNVSMGLNYRFNAVLCKTPNAAAAGLEEATLAAGAAMRAKTPSMGTRVEATHKSGQRGQL